MQKTYKIGEAATLLNLKTYVLRFWESEFSQIAPLRTEKGQRLYTQKHLDLLFHIKYLLHERGLTIDGAKKELKASKVTAKKPHKGLQEPNFCTLAEPVRHEKYANQEHDLAAQAHLSHLHLDPASIPPQPAIPANQAFIEQIIDIPAGVQPKIQKETQGNIQNTFVQESAYPKTLDNTLAESPNFMHHILTELEAVATLLRS